MPGDEILPDAALQTTRAALPQGPEHIGHGWCRWDCRREGAYTYDWIERLLGIDIRNEYRILPEFQHLEPGEYVGQTEKGQGIQVREVQTERSLVLQWVPARSTWSFGLYPEGDRRTRLVSRNRMPGNGPLFWAG